MNILYLVPHVPNPTKVRSLNHIKGLLAAGHHVTVATFVRGAADTRHVERLREMGAVVVAVPISRLRMLWNSARTVVTNKPFQATLLYSPVFLAQVRAAIAAHPPDIVHVEHLRMAQYGLVLKTDYPTLWDAVDHLTSLFQQASVGSASRLYRWLAAIEAARLRGYEQWLTGQFAATLVISVRDQQLFQHENPYADRIHYAPFGLPLTPNTTAVERVFNRLIMTGTLNYHPNVAAAVFFVDAVMPLVLHARPDMTLQLVGANPHPRVQALAGDKVEVTGFVASLDAALRAAAIAVAPVQYGSGLQIKVVEAFMSGTPVVATPVALRGLDVRHLEHVLIAETPQDFADAIIQLANDADLRERLGLAGRAYVEQQHRLEQTTAALVGQYETVSHAFR